MLKDNLKTLRKNKGISQEELSVKLNVVRQTVSKWEQGLSVPDSELLIRLAEELDTPVSTLLGENIDEKKQDDLKVIAEKLEVINLQLSQKKENRRKIFHWIFIIICLFTILAFIVLGTSVGNSYIEWNYNDPELAVLGTLIHSIVWIFVRIAPLIFIGSIVGIILTRKKK